MVNEIITVNNKDTALSALQGSIASFSKPLSDFISDLNLPIDNILQPIEEREKILEALRRILNLLSNNDKEKAVYLSKFVITSTIGLFDASLNYLWDETVKVLRKLVASFDLFYYFNVAASISGRYKNLSTEDDLPLINDHDMLEICRRIGLINDVNFERLNHVNYLRNHASAAHPSENDTNGYEIVSCLENCIRYAIQANPDASSVQIKTLLTNVRTLEIPKEDVKVICNEITKLEQCRIDDLLFTLYGMYSDETASDIIEKNIVSIAPCVFENASEEKKYVIGAKYGLYQKQGNVKRKEKTLRFLEIVNGIQYKDEDSLAAELQEKLQDLKSVHYDTNNFYNEYAPAVAIQYSLPVNNQIPRAVKVDFVKVISICYIGNGLGYRDGVCESALPYYKQYIQLFKDDEIVIFLKFIKDIDFQNLLSSPKQEERAKKLINFMFAKTNVPVLKELLNDVLNFKGKISKVSKDTSFSNKLDRVLKNWHL